MRPLLPLALALALGACVAGPPPEVATPVPELPNNFLYAPDSRTSASLAALLPSGDPAFSTLADRALENAPSLAEALARVEAARAGARRAGAERLPRLDADANVTGNRINPNQFGDGAGGFIDTEQISYGANLVASWDADLFGRLRSQERAALARIDAADASANAVRIALVSEIAGNVTDWRTLAARTDALQQDVEAAQQLARLAKSREDAGLSPGFDRVRAESQASASRSRLAALQSERARIIGRLVTLTGMDGQSVNAALAQGAPTLEPAPAPASLPSELLANRPDVLAAAADLAATDQDLAATARARFPRLTLSGVLGLLAFNPGDLFDEDSLVGTLAAGVAGPLLDFGRIEAEINGAAANKKAAFAAYRGAVFQALGDAETAYGLIAASDAEAQLAVQERDELARAASLANTRYRAGLADFLTVLEARRAADASGERAAAALGRATRARILLWQALGGEREGVADGGKSPPP
ncbi:efflux transporter outer membrane subunit [Erythrobacter sp. JK5]|uniref:efflux transporter outer membrane subunit n=1 Tax=Erythrobacter sp. JK5 TaxID=2829500 RepID=UPI001BAE0C35|nr:efflux transporter outer membrane subunit [Erythrobacter sp. JK5]QUL37686.1 efflux transporter outer membrane subunit [Erythrobacter sp. JK5]